MKNSNDTIRNRSRDLPVCRAVPQPLRAPIYNWSDLLIYFGVVFHETRHHAQAHVTSGALIQCSLSLAMRTTQTAAQLGR
jgi:hypothetical protein